MAKMKIEYLSHYKQAHGWTLRDRLIAHLPRYSHHIAAIPGLAFLLNLRNKIPGLALLGEKIMQISAKRSLPTWRRDTAWRSMIGSTEEALFTSAKPVVLWADTFNGCFETENIKAAVNVLEASGYTVHIPQKKQGHYCCGRTYLASGMVNEARASAQELLDAFTRYTEKNISIIGLEPCHQKSFDAVKPIIALLKMIPQAQPQLIESSCCGMAGSFGYESEHHQVSLQMAELQLLPAIRQAPDAIVLADGSSCRHQIKDGANREALHVARILELHLE
jgi:Fe-S oxidoreductase